MGDDMIARDLSLVFVEITDERTRQDAKWGGVPGLERRDDHTYAAVLGEEFGEVCKAWLERRDDHTYAAVLGEEFGEVCKAWLERDTDALRAELIQTAAVAVAWVEELDNGGMAARP
jgi:NTP pyrophosphatase (non-canonical NTP hydrolase)